MEYFQDFQKQLANMVWQDYLDIILVAFLFYQLMRFIRSTAATRIIRVVMAVALIYLLTDVMELHVLNFLLDQVLAVGAISMVVLFQPEIRRVMDRLGGVSIRKLLNPDKNAELMDTVIHQTVQACEVMSREKIGALMVFERQQRLDEFFKTGTLIDGIASEQLIRNIFFPKAALHDGAMIIRDGRVTAAGCVLPLSDSHRLSADLGTRHRAGVGMSEASDAVVVIVSEETGTISVAVGGMLKRHLAPQTLERLLQKELCKKEEESRERGNPLLRLVQKFADKEEKKHEE